MNRVISADWVLPIEGPPLRDGAVAIEDGRIAAVGRRDELGEGTHYPDSVIVPGFVNAHSHLEYAVYGGFGDGLGDFAEWITLHIQRKARIGWEQYVGIARFGAAQCLASGITTVGDCSYSGATRYIPRAGAQPEPVTDCLRLRLAPGPPTWGISCRREDCCCSPSAWGPSWPPWTPASSI